MKKTLGIIVASLFIACIFCSCKSKEEKVIDNLNKLTEKIENKSADWDSEQWGDTFKKIEKIHSEMEKCDFSSEQMKEFGEAEGRLSAAIIKNGASSLGSSVGSFIQSAGSFLNGFQEGINEGDRESLQEIGSSVNEALRNIEDQLSDE